MQLTHKACESHVELSSDFDPKGCPYWGRSVGHSLGPHTLTFAPSHSHYKYHLLLCTLCSVGVIAYSHHARVEATQTTTHLSGNLLPSARNYYLPPRYGNYLIYLPTFLYSLTSIVFPYWPSCAYLGSQFGYVLEHPDIDL